ncbi:hypothetical protein WJX74_003569 [Apatococcus lobatus]|uniref:Uncharacterized protein n=1 Tax=Apatococcus lobatus TaxID=904363 RepID=A0AAW1RZP5_9CHLO
MKSTVFLSALDIDSRSAYEVTRATERSERLYYLDEYQCDKKDYASFFKGVTFKKSILDSDPTVNEASIAGGAPTAGQQPHGDLADISSSLASMSITTVPVADEKFFGQGDQQDVLRSIMLAAKQAVQGTPASGTVKMRLNFGHQFFYTTPRGSQTIPSGKEFTLRELEALKVGGDVMGIRTVYSNSLSLCYLEVLKTKAKATGMLSFEQVEEKKTASMHVIDEYDKQKVLSFSRSG